jgi:hypothetical protein
MLMLLPSDAVATHHRAVSGCAGRSERGIDPAVGRLNTQLNESRAASSRLVIQLTHPGGELMVTRLVFFGCRRTLVGFDMHFDVGTFF